MDENNKKIAKNSLILYFRMFVTIIVTLYTTRVVLRVLGASDYGIFDVVGGIIGMLSYVYTILSGGISRFLTVQLGKGNIVEQIITFKISNSIALTGAIIVLFVGESIGLWFVCNKLNIEPDRLNAAIWVFQCAIFSSVLTLLQMPYGASIIAHENINFYGYMAIIEAIMKLLIVYCLSYSAFDKLITYSLLLFIVNLLYFTANRIYCLTKYEEVTWKFSFEKERFKAMLSYSGWTMIGAFAGLLNNYGISILLNVFFGTIANAARAIAAQICQVINKLYGGLLTASKPQIFKLFSQGKIEEMSSLINNTSKYCGFLSLFIVIPLFFHIDDILSIWLGDNVPPLTSAFVRCLAIQSLCNSIDYPIGVGIQAIGRMKLPNLTTSFIYLVVFPIAYLAFRNGASPIIGYVIFIACAPFVLLSDLIILRHYISFSIRNYVKQTILPVSKQTCICIVIPAVCELFFTIEGLTQTIAKITISLVSIAVTLYIFGAPKSVKIIIINRFKKLKNNE